MTERTQFIRSAIQSTERCLELFRTEWRVARQRSRKLCPPACPERIEAGSHFGNHRSRRQDVPVTEVLRRIEIEILVADIPSPDDGDDAVDGK
jgi:hypothetical protein